MPKTPPDTIILERPDLDGNDPPRYGDRIRFTLKTDVTAPFVHLEVTQNGRLVSEGWEGYFPGALYGTDGPGVFSLYSALWTGGAADAKATLCQWNPHKLALTPIVSTTFGIAA